MRGIVCPAALAAVCLPVFAADKDVNPDEIIQKFAAKEAGVPRGAEQLHLPSERQNPGTGRRRQSHRREVGRGVGHHLLARRQAHARRWSTRR